MTEQFIKPFRMGDVVVVTQSDADSSFTEGEEYIIYSTYLREGGLLEYSTNRGEWIRHEQLSLARECDAASMKQLYEDVEAEIENEEEDEGDGA